MIQWATAAAFALLAIAIVAVAFRRKSESKDSELHIHKHRFESGQKRMRAILSSIPDCFFVVDGDGFFQEYRSDLTPYSDSPSIVLEGKSLRYFHSAEDAESILAAVSDVIATGESRQVEYRTGSVDSPRYFECRISPLGLNTVLCLSRDITKRLGHEKLIMQTLYEKEILLREVHHRVKNNLQIISSMISIQSGSLVDERDRALMRDMQHRIHTMAQIHDQLYQTDNFVSIDVKTYISSVVDDLSVSVCLPNGIRATTGRIDSLSVSLDVAIPLGLIVNEVILGAVRYYAKHKCACSFALDFYLAGERAYLDVRGDVSSSLDEYIREDSDPFGAVLVPALVTQLEGKIELMGEPGVPLRLTFLLSVMSRLGRNSLPRPSGGTVDNSGQS
jgi:two-component sensor histidine kinase